MACHAVAASESIGEVCRGHVESVVLRGQVVPTPFGVCALQSDAAAKKRWPSSEKTNIRLILNKGARLLKGKKWQSAQKQHRRQAIEENPKKMWIWNKKLE